MKLVILDGFTVNPGDLDWSALEALGPVTIYPRTQPDQIQERAASADLLLTNKTVLSQRDMQALPQLKYIGVLATGYNVVALPLAAGALAPLGILLSPAIGALLMSLSTVIVALNAQLLRRVELGQ